MICGIAAMQLVEQNKLTLDDANQVGWFCPELKTVCILKGFDEKGRPELVKKKNCITLRMLLNHTAGFGYAFFNKDLRRYGQPASTDEFDAHHSSILSQPILYEPGTDWSYGIGIDWAGTLIERVTKHTCTKSTGTRPAKRSGSEIIRYRRPLISTTADVPSVYNSAGAGCFARPTDYAQLLAALVNNGVSPTTSNRILSPKSIDEMFTNQIPDFPDFGRKGIVSAKSSYTNDVPDLYPQPRDQPQGWGLTFMLMIHEAATGRGPNTAWWAGLPNLFWWCDREKGVAGLLATQILPFKDDDVIGLWVQIEKAIYDDLESAKGGK